MSGGTQGPQPGSGDRRSGSSFFLDAGCLVCQIFSSLFDSVSSLPKGTLLFPQWPYPTIQVNLPWLWSRAPLELSLIQKLLVEPLVDAELCLSGIIVPAVLQIYFLEGETDNTQLNNEQDPFRRPSEFLRRKQNKIM